MENFHGEWQPASVNPAEIFNDVKTKLKKVLIAHFESNAKMTIPQAKAKIIRQMKRDQYDNNIRVGNVKLFYTDNPNYANASGTGLGAGFYLAKTGFTGYVDVKV